MTPCDLTKRELVGILEVIEFAQSCSCSEQVKALLIKSMGIVEADHSACGTLRVEGAAPREITYIVNGNYPEDMFDHYLCSRLYLKDPLVRYHSNFSTTRLWSEIFEEINDICARQVIDYAADYGLRYGVSSSLYVPGTESVAIVSFAGAKNRFAARHKEILDILAVHINKAVVRASPGPPEVMTPGPGHPEHSFV
ncbi:MAG: autoinducer binding domain-containing protein [Thermodesulfobacteriota bacterium]